MGHGAPGGKAAYPPCAVLGTDLEVHPTGVVLSTDSEVHPTGVAVLCGKAWLGECEAGLRHEQRISVPSTMIASRQARIDPWLLRIGESITAVFCALAERGEDGTRSVPATFLATLIDSPLLVV